MPSIPLTNSELLIEVSDEDYLYLLLRGPYHLAGKGYARTNMNPCEYLHRLVANRMGISLKVEIDHADRNKLNSKRDNLRASTRSEQMQNSGLQSNSTTGHKNISRDLRPGRKSWCVDVQRDGKRVYIGAYETLEAAIKARDDYYKRHNMVFVE